MMSLISLTGCTKQFNDTPILNNIDLSANQGQLTAIIGSSGSGKSTLLRCLNLLETPDKGMLSYNDKQFNFEQGQCTNLSKKVYKQQLRALRQEVGMVFQHYNLWPHMNLIENIIEAPCQLLNLSKAKATEQGIDLLEQVGLADYKTRYPHELSGGQQQRVAIARALAMQPKVLLLDEPTAALDPTIAVGILDILKNLADSGLTMLFVTHAIHFISQYADEVVFVNEGKVFEQGLPSHLLKNPQTPALKTFLEAVYAY